ncbi:hypothetical protein Q8F55_002747 [Vanrija albida]|uniref:Uncharacterized protein n=1 Tax=Vanrija albida TaxID=181172 RepID=A0ABR3QAN5_9TREE
MAPKRKLKSPKVPKAPKTPNIHKDWAGGNFTLISSDGVHFKVMDYHLLSAGGVQQLDFIDDELECSLIVKCFLQLAVHGHIEAKRPPQVLVLLAQFLRKYDCGPTLRLLVSLCGTIPNGRVLVFVLGAVLDNVDVCAEAMRYPLPDWETVSREPIVRVPTAGPTILAAQTAALQSRGFTHAPPHTAQWPKEIGFGGAFEHGCQLDTQTWSLPLVKLVPDDYRWALDHAFHRTKGRKIIKFLAEEFREIMAGRRDSVKAPLNLGSAT